MVSMVKRDPDHRAGGVVFDSIGWTGHSWFGQQRAGSLIHSSLPPIPDDRVTGSGYRDSVFGRARRVLFPVAADRGSGPHRWSRVLGCAGQARKDFQRACKAANDRRLAKAEEQLRRALQADAQYPAAWLLLGQVLKAEQKPDDARQACAQALKVDPNYLPAGLCLAELCAIEQKWAEMLRLANASIALDPANNFHGYFLRGGSIFRTAPAARSREECLCGPPRSTRTSANLEPTSCWLKSTKCSTSRMRKRLNCANI